MGDITQPKVPSWEIPGGKVLDTDQSVPHLQAPVTLGGAPIRQPADIDVSVAGGARGVHSPTDAEPQPSVCFVKCHLHQAPTCLMASPLHSQMNNVSCPLEYFSREAVGGIGDTDIVNMGDDVTNPQGPLQVCRAPGGDVRDDHRLGVEEEVAAKDGKSQPLNSSLQSDI